MTYAIVNPADSRVDVCSGSIRKTNTYLNSPLDFLESKTLHAFPIVIEGERFEREESDENDDAADEDDFVNLQATPEKPRRLSSDGGREATQSPLTASTGVSKVRFKICTALNEVGWRRRDVIKYGHDQMMQDPAWWFAFDQSGRNIVIDHLCHDFLTEREGNGGGSGESEGGNQEEKKEKAEQSKERAGCRGEREGGGGGKESRLEMHAKTKLYYFKF